MTFISTHIPEFLRNASFEGTRVYALVICYNPAYDQFNQKNMNSLNQAIQYAYNASGNSKEANKAYLEFIKANLIIPLDISSTETNPEVLFLLENAQRFLPVFTEMEHLSSWAKDISQQIKLLKLSGVDLLKGIGRDIYVCLDIGTPFYKEFSPEEIERMRSMTLKLFK